MTNLLKHKFELTSSLERLLTDAQAKEIKEDLGLARRFLNVLTARIDKEIDENVKESEASFNYELPNWSLKQAELMGYRRALRKIKDVIGPIEE